MLELLPAWILAVGLIVVCSLYGRAFRQLDRGEADPIGSVALTCRERGHGAGTEARAHAAVQPGPPPLMRCR